MTENSGYTRDPGWHPLDLNIDPVEEPIPGRDYGPTYAEDRTSYYYWRGLRPGM